MKNAYFVTLMLIGSSFLHAMQPNKEQDQLNRNLDALLSKVKYEKESNKQKLLHNAQKLIEQGADVNFVVNSTKNIPEASLLNKHISDPLLVKFLLNHGANPNKAGIGMPPLNTLLKYAADLKPKTVLEVAALLLGAGADMNAHTVHYDTPLLLFFNEPVWSAENSSFYVDIVNLFLQASKLRISSDAKSFMRSKAKDTSYFSLLPSDLKEDLKNRIKGEPLDILITNKNGQTLVESVQFQKNKAQDQATKKALDQVLLLLQDAQKKAVADKARTAQ